MKIKHLIAALAVSSSSLHAAAVVIDNTDINTDKSGSQSSYLWQTFTASVAGGGSGDTVAANSPLPATVFLQSATFLNAPTGAEQEGQIFLTIAEVDSSTNTLGTVIASSTNSIDINATVGATETSFTYNFANIAIDSGTEYALAFSTTGGGTHTQTLARLSAARNAGGTFANTYDGGEAVGNVGQNVAFDTRFSVTVDTVPEPSSTALLGLGGLALIMRRRK